MAGCATAACRDVPRRGRISRGHSPAPVQPFYLDPAAQLHQLGVAGDQNRIRPLGGGRGRGVGVGDGMVCRSNVPTFERSDGGIVRCPILSELPPPPPGRTGWPWTEDTPQLAETMPDGRLPARLAPTALPEEQGAAIHGCAVSACTVGAGSFPLDAAWQTHRLAVGGGWPPP